jgi:predicted enzyme related to lactoylglutathione lyase
VPNSQGHFVWYELMTTDVAAAKAFYAEVVGWGIRDASMPGLAYAMFFAGTSAVAGVLNLSDDARDVGAKPRWIGYVCVGDLDAAVELVKRRGGAVHVPPTQVSNLSRFAIVADPQTAALGMISPLSGGLESPAEAGAPGFVGWHELLAADCGKALAFYGELFGWKKADADVTDSGTYAMFSVRGQLIGGTLTKPETMQPFWLYYFNVADIETAAKRVTAGGGQILDSPVQLPAGTWVIQCVDPQGALFALEGHRPRKPVGYFERVGARDSSDPKSRRWSW